MSIGKNTAAGIISVGYNFAIAFDKDWKKDVYHDKKQCYTAVVDSYMIVLFTELLRGYSRIIAPDADRIPSDFRLSEVIQYIQNRCDTVTLAETAAHFNCESAYLSKIIKRFSNQTFTSLRNEARLLKARVLLENTDMKIDAIARETGYENLHFFYEIFRKKYGRTLRSTGGSPGARRKCRRTDGFPEVLPLLPLAMGTLHADELFSAGPVRESD